MFLNDWELGRIPIVQKARETALPSRRIVSFDVQLMAEEEEIEVKYRTLSKDSEVLLCALETNANFGIQINGKDNMKKEVVC